MEDVKYPPIGGPSQDSIFSAVNYLRCVVPHAFFDSLHLQTCMSYTLEE